MYYIIPVIVYRRGKLRYLKRAFIEGFCFGVESNIGI